MAILLFVADYDLLVNAVADAVPANINIFIPYIIIQAAHNDNKV